jgi:hypothetical protein
MSLLAGPYEFHHVTYDGPSDVIYAALEAPRPSARQEKTAEADFLRFDDRGEFFGVVLVDPRARLDRDGAVYLILPTGDRVRVQGVETLIRRGQPA